MSLTKLEIQSKYPEVYESYSLQAALPEYKYVEKMKHWSNSSINCYEHWAVPYFLEREKEKKRPCLRLNYQPEGKCNDCTKGTCRYDRVCFMCGMEGHGAFQSYPGGKMKGELKCPKHRSFLAQLSAIKLQYGLDEEGLKALFKTPTSSTATPTSASRRGSKSRTSGGAGDASSPSATASSGTAQQGSSKRGVRSPAVAGSRSPRIAVPADKAITDISGSPSVALPLPQQQKQHSLVLEEETGWSFPMSSSSSLLDALRGGASIGGGSDDSTRRPWERGGGGNGHAALPSPPSAATTSLGALSQANHAVAVGRFPPMPELELGLLEGFNSSSFHLGDAQHTDTGKNGASDLSVLPMGAIGNLSTLQSKYQQSFDIVDSDEFAGPGALHANLRDMARDESNGSFVTRGAYVTPHGTQEVQVRAWRRTPVQAGLLDADALRGEVKALRILSRRCAHVARIVHHGFVELTSRASVTDAATASTTDYVALVTETSEIGSLDSFTAMQMQLSPLSSSASTTAQSLRGFSTVDLQSICVQLIEGLIVCHELNVRHRDIRPQNILVCRCADDSYSRQFSRGLVLKYANFTPVALLPLCAADKPVTLQEPDRWCAPEVDRDARRNGQRFEACSDVWSLGLTIYYIASGGQLPFESFKQACDAAVNPDYRRQCLEKHGLHQRLPMLHDLVERLVRPAYMRTDLQIIRCHPFLWTAQCRRSMLASFASAVAVRDSEAISSFVAGIDKISPLYVFGQEGWVAAMAPFLLELVPQKIKAEHWWSGAHLLQAIQTQLQRPELLREAAYPRLSALQSVYACIRQITESDFPRLLVLLYELGGIHGKWVWDGDEITHSWN